MRAYLLTMILVSAAWNSIAQATNGYRETIDLHLNTHLFITGETVLFTVHCRSDDNLSELSSIAYIEIISSDLKPVFQSKVKLDRGVGSGDFFLTAKIPSGNYTIIAYTRWMRNFSSEYFFRDEIVVLNPMSVSKVDGPREQPQNEKTEVANSNSSSKTFLLVSEKSSYGFREKVRLLLAQLDTLRVSRLSVSVRPCEKSLAFKTSTEQQVVRSKSDQTNVIRFLPDMRVELISGIAKDRKTGSPLKNTFVTMSAPGRHFTFLISKTNDAGRFFFNAEGNRSAQIFFDVLRDGMDDVEFILDKEFLDNYEDFRPSEFSVTKDELKAIEKRFVHSQIENAFYSVKKDAIHRDSVTRFFGTPEKIFVLRQFTSFPTMEDIFREIIFDIVVKKKDEHFSLLLINSLTSYRFDNAPLMLIDGMHVKDPDVVMALNPADVRLVALKTRRYYYGGVGYDGIISIETYNGNAKGLAPRTSTSFTPVAEQKLYYFPIYDGKKDLSRIPDYRAQLYWNPSIELRGEAAFSFYTGDIPGDYCINVHGVSDAGELFDVRHVISIGNP